jgi:hypothetical protein
VEESLKWLLTNFQQVSVAGLLALIIVGRYFEWWVDRPTYRKCVQRSEKLETAAEAHAQEIARELADLRAELRPRRRSP